MFLRGLILLLVCMNLGVSAWWTWHRAPEDVRLPAQERGVPSLRLLGEMPAGTLPMIAAELDAAPLGPGATSVCLSLGPFQTPADLRRAMGLLTPRVGRIQFREVQATELRGYRVYLPAAGDRAQALTTARALAERGIRDYYVVTAGAQENTVSLGVFRDLPTATQRRDAIAAIGFNATVEPRTEDVPQWWVDVAAAEGFDWQATLQSPIGIEARNVACL